MKIQPTLFAYTTYFILVFSMLCSSALANNNKKETLSPEFVKGTTKIDSEKLIELAGNLTNMVMVDSRIVTDRDQGYIEGSISLPNTETTCESLGKIIPDLANPSLFYCNGIKCGRSAKAIAIAVGCGYTNLYWFRGGFKEWLDKGYPVVSTR